MTDLQAIETRLWSLLEPYRDECEPATIYGVPTLRWPSRDPAAFASGMSTGSRPWAADLILRVPKSGLVGPLINEMGEMTTEGDTRVERERHLHRRARGSDPADTAQDGQHDPGDDDGRQGDRPEPEPLLAVER